MRRLRALLRDLLREAIGPALDESGDHREVTSLATGCSSGARRPTASAAPLGGVS
ncbi:hypothetical protein [Streptomyces sp. KS 21]|uniref:hypothetical protein n=1 Tax=Streptomyces sp. KS 21 TaxID=2485150 RepID=UPI001414CCDD|nr:hypothetical protein [Streptomyces sp. KS 21]